MKKILIGLLFFFPLAIWAQDRVIPVSLSLFNESTAIPFTRFFTTPVHPGIQAGTSFNYTAGLHGRLFQTASICYFYHNHLAQGIGINSELGYEYRLNAGFAFSGLLGVGYLHTFATADEFSFANGSYQKKTDKGNARFSPSLSIKLGYFIHRKEKYSPEIFISYQSWIEYPYSPDFIPLMTHINLHLGTRFFIKTHAKKSHE